MSISYVPYVRKLKKNVKSRFLLKDKKTLRMYYRTRMVFQEQKVRCVSGGAVGCLGVTEASHEKRTSVSRKRVQELQKR